MNAKIKNAMTVTITPVRDIYAHLVRFFLPHLVALWVRYLYCSIDCFRLRDLFGSWILEQRDYPVLELDGYKFLSDDVSLVPDAAHFSGIVPSVAHVFDAPRLGREQLFSAGHVFSLGQYARGRQLGKHPGCSK
jgi:hypothetical protein